MNSAERQHKADLFDVTDLATADLADLWRAYDLDDAARAQQQLSTDLRSLLLAYGGAAAALAVDFYDTLRFQFGPSRSRFSARAVPPDTTHVDRTAEWALRPLSEGNQVSALSRASAATEMWVANADRTTVATNAERDRAAVKLIRQTAADCCSFCLVMSTRPDLGSGYHPNCRCTVSPAFERDAVPDHFHEFKRIYEDAAQAAKAAGEPRVIPNGRNRRDTILWRIRESTGRK